MAKKLLVVVTLVLIVTMVLSACAKAAPGGLPIATPSPTVENTPTATMTPFPTPIPEDITNSITVDSLGTNTIEITNTAKYRIFSIYRRLATEVEKVVELKPQESFIDNVIWDGTQYYYWGEDQWGNNTNEVDAITEIAETTKQRGVFYAWNDVARQMGAPGRMVEIDTSSTVYDYYVHGVDVKIIFEKSVADLLTEEELKVSFLGLVESFHKHWQFYEGFPLDEYRIVFWDRAQKIETVYGLSITKDWISENRSNILRFKGSITNWNHEIGHAWIGQSVNPFDGWLREGLTTYTDWFSNSDPWLLIIDAYYIEPFREHRLETLPSMYQTLFGSNDARAYYDKGAFLFYLVNQRISQESEKPFSHFLKYLYEKYFLSQNGSKKSIITFPFISTGSFISDLNEYFSIDFSDLFNKYAFGNEDILDILTIDPQYFPVFISASGSEIKTKSTEIINPLVTQFSLKDNMEMVFVPEGEFLMGVEISEQSDEVPQNKVFLDSYWIDRTEVTNSMFSAFVEQTNYKTQAELAGASFVIINGNSQGIAGANWLHPQGPDSNLNGLDQYPVTQISWGDASAYCEWAGKRLPSEAEWEKAARGENDLLDPWGDNEMLSQYMNFNASSSTEVGKYLWGSSPYGALDMAGNVWEWVADFYDGEYYTLNISDNPKGPLSGDYNIKRGGSWANYVRFSYRFETLGVQTDNTSGFRCATFEDFETQAQPAPRPTFTLFPTATLGPTQTPMPEIPLDFTPQAMNPVETKIEISSIDNMSMVYVPEGEFLMGHDWHLWGGPGDRLHFTYLFDYWIDQTEVTNEMYAKCVDKGICTQPLDYGSANRENYYGNPEYRDYPVVFVNWYQAKTYCEWAGRRLPTEAEWEKAARGTDARFYAWGDQEPSELYMSMDTDNPDTSPVGSYPKGASPYGALDMTGNVWEWVADWGWDPLYQLNSPYINPVGPVNGSQKVVKGGGIDIGGEKLHVELLHTFGGLYEDPLTQYDNFGIRCAVSGERNDQIPRYLPTPTPSITPTATLSQEKVNATPIPVDSIQPVIKVATTDGMPRVFVPEGVFFMGRYLQKNYLDSYWIDQLEVTNKMYEKCVASSSCTPPKVTNSVTRNEYYGNPVYGDFPVINISYYQAKDYCEWVGRRIPSEAEWEKAARGTDDRLFPWGNKQTYLYSNTIGPIGDTTKVGSYPEGASPYGALDMAGNVWEYTQDLFIANNNSISAVRGGAWDFPDQFVFTRSDMDMKGNSESVGFRCVSDNP